MADKIRALRKRWFYAGIGRRKLFGRNLKGPYQPRKAGDIELPPTPQPRRFIGIEPKRYFL